MRTLPVFLVGLALGGVASVFFLAPPKTRKNSSEVAPAAHAVTLPAPLTPPARLPLPEASDALAAWLAADGTSGFAARSAALRALLTVLPDECFPRLLDALAAREGEDERRLRGIAFTVWTERAPASAARWVAAFPLGPTFDVAARRTLCHEAVTSWAALDFGAVLAWADSLSDEKLRQFAAQRAIVCLAERDPVSALALAQARGPGFFKDTQNRLLSAWAARDPAGALRTLGPLILETDPASGAIDNAFRAWCGSDAASAITWLAGQPQTDHQKLLYAVQGALRGQDSIRPLIDTLSRAPAFPGRDTLIDSLVTSHAGHDAAILDWLTALPDAARRAELLGRVTPTYADPALLDRHLDLALDLPVGPDRDIHLTRTLTAWAEADPAAALAWLEKHETANLETVRARLEGLRLGTLAATDPAAALARWQTLPEGEARAAALPGLASAWAKTDPAAAARWLFTSLPPVSEEAARKLSLLGSLMSMPGGGKIRMDGVPDHLLEMRQTLADTVAAWSAQKPADALSWVETLPPTDYRTIALNALGAGIDGAPDPARRADYLSRIADPKLRAEALSNVMFNWLQTDLPSARAWLDSHDALPPEEAARLITQATTFYP